MRFLPNDTWMGDTRLCPHCGQDEAAHIEGSDYACGGPKAGQREASFLEAVEDRPGEPCPWTEGSRLLCRDVLKWVASGRRGRCPVSAATADTIGSVLFGEDWEVRDDRP